MPAQAQPAGSGRREAGSTWRVRARQLQRFSARGGEFPTHALIKADDLGRARLLAPTSSFKESEDEEDWPKNWETMAKSLQATFSHKNWLAYPVALPVPPQEPVPQEEDAKTSSVSSDTAVVPEPRVGSDAGTKDPVAVPVPDPPQKPREKEAEPSSISSDTLAVVVPELRASPDPVAVPDLPRKPREKDAELSRATPRPLPVTDANREAVTTPRFPARLPARLPPRLSALPATREERHEHTAAPVSGVRPPPESHRQPPRVPRYSDEDTRAFRRWLGQHGLRISDRWRHRQRE
ncbi:hypothetical protein QBC39DRAFT_178742 [Podospora conica]|nr:hypothetical protein QBC39DRAFT_178742 [Schizothecium conicum]